MSFIERLFGFGKEVILLSDKTEQLSRNVDRLAQETQGLDRRMVRVETILDMARYRSAERRNALPGRDSPEKD